MCREGHHTTPIKAPIHMKAIYRQRQLFRSGAPCQPPFAPQQDWGSESVCVCERSLCHCWDKPVPGASHFSPRIAAPLPVSVPGLWLCSARQYVCQIEESPSVTRLSSFLWGKWKASLTALLIDLDPPLQCLDRWLLVLSRYLSELE